MPAGPRIRSNSEFGLTTDAPLTAGATSFNSTRLSLFPVVSAAHAVVTLDPRAINGEPEIVIITAHTAAATVATVTRGAYGTAARSHPVGTEWIHAPLDEDFIEILTSSTRPTDPYRGQTIFETDTNRYVGRSTADAWQDINLFADPPSCRVFNNANISVNNSTAATPTYNSERWDTASMHDTAVNSERITIPVTGLYIVSLSIIFAARNDYEVCWGAIRRNGTVYLAISNSRASIVGASDLHITTTTIAKFTAGEFITSQAFQRNTAAAASNLVFAAEYGPEFSAVWVGRG